MQFLKDSLVLVPFLKRDQLSNNNLIYTIKHKFLSTVTKFRQVFFRHSMGDKTDTVPTFTAKCQPLFGFPQQTMETNQKQSKKILSSLHIFFSAQEAFLKSIHQDNMSVTCIPP